MFTDNVHKHDAVGPNTASPEALSEAAKRLKPRLLRRLIDAHKMDQALIFCRWVARICLDACLKRC